MGFKKLFKKKTIKQLEAELAVEKGFKKQRQANTQIEAHRENVERDLSKLKKERRGKTLGGKVGKYAKKGVEKASVGAYKLTEKASTGAYNLAEKGGKKLGAYMEAEKKKPKSKRYGGMFSNQGQMAGLSMGGSDSGMDGNPFSQGMGDPLGNFQNPFETKPKKIYKRRKTTKRKSKKKKQSVVVNGKRYYRLKSKPKKRIVKKRKSRQPQNPWRYSL